MDLDIQSYSLTDDAAPTLVFSGRGVLNFYGQNASTSLCDQTGTPGAPCPEVLELFVPTDVYLKYSEAGTNPPQTVVVMARPKPAGATLSVDCGG